MAKPNRHPKDPYDLLLARINSLEEEVRRLKKAHPVAPNINDESAPNFTSVSPYYDPDAIGDYSLNEFDAGVDGGTRDLDTNGITYQDDTEETAIHGQLLVDRYNELWFHTKDRIHRDHPRYGVGYGFWHQLPRPASICLTGGFAGAIGTDTGVSLVSWQYSGQGTKAAHLFNDVLWIDEDDPTRIRVSRGGSRAHVPNTLTSFLCVGSLLWSQTYANALNDRRQIAPVTSVSGAPFAYTENILNASGLPSGGFFGVVVPQDDTLSEPLTLRFGVAHANIAVPLAIYSLEMMLCRLGPVPANNGGSGLGVATDRAISG